MRLNPQTRYGSFEPPLTETSKDLGVELVDACNLHCSYCLRDDAQLYGKMHALPVPLLDRVLGEVKALWGPTHIGFTGGEASLHPQFEDVVAAVARHGLKCGLVTNGWLFERILKAAVKFQTTLTEIAFSLDGVNAETHDAWRGKGSFERVVRALALCREAGIATSLKVVLRRDTAPYLADFCLFGARMGASAIMFGPLFPTSQAAEESACSIAEQREALRELAFLKKTVRVQISLAAGLYDPRPEPTCRPLGGGEANIDFKGRLTLCFVLSGFRGAERPDDLIADLTQTSFAEAHQRLADVVAMHNARRLKTFDALAGAPPPLHTGSSCLYCIHSFGKGPARGAETPLPPVEVRGADRFALTAGRVVAKTDTGAIVANPVQGGRIRLNETASFILERLLAGEDVTATTSSLQAAFAVEESGAQGAVRQTIADLLRTQELIPVSGPQKVQR